MKNLLNLNNRVRKAMFCLSVVAVLIGCGGGVSGSTTADTTLPTLAASAATSPSNGSTGVGYATTVSFTASEPLSTASIKLSCEGQDMAGVTGVAGAVVTFRPAAPGLAANARCAASIVAAGTKDLAGNAFASNATISNFTVKPLNCTGTSNNSPPSFNGTALIATCGNIFVDPAVAKNQYPVIVENVNTARQSGSAIYGTLVSAQPDVVVCSSTACGTFFAGASLRNVAIPAGAFAGQYTAPRMTVVLTAATYSRNQYVLAHEFSHVEVNARLNGQRVPAWFDEGLATVIGDEPQCQNVTGKGISDLRTLDSVADWTAYTGSSATFEKTYCQARAEVAAWITKNGNAAVARLLTAVGQGGAFSSNYGAILTQ